MAFPGSYSFNSHFDDEPRRAFNSFYSLHNLGSQRWAALARTMTLSPHNYFGTVATLPFPTSVKSNGKNASGKIHRSSGRWKEALPYQIALHIIISSILCGFPGGAANPCHLVRPRFHSAMNDLPSIEQVMDLKRCDHELRITMHTIRRHLSSFGLGAVVSGLSLLNYRLRQEWDTSRRSARLCMDRLSSVFQKPCRLRPMLLG